MLVTIVGAGNIGTQFAVHCAEKGHEVILYTGNVSRIRNELVVIDDKGSVIHTGKILYATHNPEMAFSHADVVFVTVPAFYMSNISRIMEPYSHVGQRICLVPGTGGGECAFKGCFEKGAILFGLQRVPSVARLVEYGHIVRATGYRDELFVAALPAKEGERCASLISDLFDMKCTVMPNYLNLTLTPSNPVLHTTRLRSIFGDYHVGTVYNSVPLFYEDWDDASSELLFACDEEVQQICKSLLQFDLQYVKSLRVHYESSTPQTLTHKIRSIIGFKGLPSPVVEVEGGFIPDFSSRYFMADFPYGLSILVQIADLVGVETPYMKETFAWYNSIVSETKQFEFKDYYILTVEDLVDFYSA